MFSWPRRSFRHTAVRLASLVATLALASVSSAAPSPKVKICHIPPGNPADFHTITIGASAYPAHLAHGDLAGACDALCATLCNDGNACTIDDTGDCEAAGCATEPVLVDCGDGNSCTADSCDPAAGCLNTHIPGCCEGDSDCDVNQTCAAGVCETTGTGPCFDTANYRGSAVVSACAAGAGCPAPALTSCVSTLASTVACGLCVNIGSPVDCSACNAALAAGGCTNVCGFQP